MSEITLEQVEELYDMLRGLDLPEGMAMPNQPQLKPKSAFSVIWFLQEHMGVIPSRYDQCSWCLSPYDSHCDGHSVDGTDEPDEWHEELGVTKAHLKEHEGNRFCCVYCEMAFWEQVLG